MQETQTYFQCDSFPDAGASHPAAGAGKAPPEKARPLSLKITTAKNGAPLSKAQKIFNRLIAQIENLRQDIARERLRLDRAVQYYVATLHPLRRQASVQRQKLVLFAHPFLKAPKTALSARQRETLRSFLSMQMQSIINVEGDLPDEKLRAIFVEIEGMTPGQVREKEHAGMREHFEEQMGDLGVDIDLSAFRADMTPEEFLKAQADLMEQFKKAGIDENEIRGKSGFPGGTTTAGAKPRKKTKKQLEREAREKAIEEARARSLSSIYKQLARAFHPDLEQDPGRKAQKQALMQELTAAYRANDMHTLLRLELEWLQNQEQDTERLGEEKLALYNEVLREQVDALREEHESLPHEPRYEALRPYAGMFGSLSHFDGPREEEKLKRTLAILSAIDTNATGANALKILKDMLRAFAQEHARLLDQQAFDEMIHDMVTQAPRGHGVPRWNW